GAGGAALSVTADVTDAHDREALIAQTQERFGRIDALINNAGRGYVTSTVDMSAGDIRTDFELNVVAPMLLTQLALPELRRHRGIVINVASIAGRIAVPPLTIYNATKFALIGWSEAMRRELRAQGVRVCIVDPGPIATEFGVATIGSQDDATKPPTGLSADVVARRIVRLMAHPQREIVIPRIYRLAIILNQWLPGLIDMGTARMVRRDLPPRAAGDKPSPPVSVQSD
ncbi:MAG TPA: SDR family NAD(P)-dependent oxidoreductase, partial [Ktedonobacterales bacterium]|nr:SDR family NAD(P)-dependent oxidoreductase [Ktedonobacterales bacterium]